MEVNEQGPFFVVERLGDGRRHGYAVMSTGEVEDSGQSTQLVSGHFNTRAEAEADLRKGLQEGKY